MKSFFLPACCYFPTTLLMVDDNNDLLLDLSLALSAHYKSKHSTSPQEIIAWIKQQGNNLETLVKQWVSTPEEQFDFTKMLVKIDIPAIKQLVYAKPLRFEQHLVLIVDYAMPEMNGLVLAEKIRRELQSPIKIIMLTGEADQITAVRAFNDKLIDRFILKSAPDYVEQLLAYIRELHTEYFQEITNLTLGSASASQKNMLKDPALNQFFNETAQRYNAVEYYLVEEPASFLFLDENKKPVWLIIKTEEDMQMLYELAKDERDTPAATVSALEKREKLVYFPDEKSKLSSAKLWHLHHAQPLKGQEIYYYAIVEGCKDYPLNLEKIVSYQQFLNS